MGAARLHDARGPRGRQDYVEQGYILRKKIEFLPQKDAFLRPFPPFLM